MKIESVIWRLIFFVINPNLVHTKHASFVQRLEPILHGIEGDYLRHFTFDAKPVRLRTSDITKLYENGIDKLLHSQMHGLYDIKHGAQLLQATYKYNPDIKPFNYYHRRNVPPNPIGINTKFSFKVPVNMTRSHVQVPTEIYREHVAILNNAWMSEPLNEVFLSNYDQYPQLLWQYFCSEAGVHRVFPGEK